MRFYLLLSFVISGSVLFAQNQQESLAAQFFAGKEYAKAADLYEQLASRSPESVYYYENLLQCYILLNDFKNAEKLVEKRIRKFDENTSYRVDRAYLCQLQGNIEKRDQLFKELLTFKATNTDEVENLANAFLKRRFYEQAIQTYLKGRKDLKEPLAFAYNLSELYFFNSRIKEGVEELTSIASDNIFMLEEVKERLQITLKSEDEYKILSQVILERLQKHPGNEAYNDLLIWSFTQLKNWEGAIVQAKAIDKRLKEDGRRLFELAYTMNHNDEYEYAMKCYDYVKSLGENKRYFYQAQQGLLNSGLRQIKSGIAANAQRLQNMEAEYLGFLLRNGVNWQTAVQVKELAELYIYFLHKPEKAIDQLLQVIALPGINPQLQGECKLDLGDAQLIVGESWEADLLYQQVEKAFTNDVLGQEARFRYARLCYFRGDFEWSMTQLDVLKGATTQLISNNAMKLWLIIQDNTGLDSNEDALKMYANADLLLFQNRYDESIRILDQIPILFPGHTLTDEIYFSKAVIAERQEKFTDAEVFYQKIIRDFNYDILADNALINLARLYEFKMKDTLKAKLIYEMIVLNYTGSYYINEARKRYRLLRGDILKEPEMN